jgi:hypothetical protein
MSQLTISQVTDFQQTHPPLLLVPRGVYIHKVRSIFRLRSYDPGNTQPRPILEVKQGSALISSMVGDHIRTERDVVHPFAFFFLVVLELGAHSHSHQFSETSTVLFFLFGATCDILQLPFYKYAW